MSGLLTGAAFTAQFPEIGKSSRLAGAARLLEVQNLIFSTVRRYDIQRDWFCFAAGYRGRHLRDRMFIRIDLHLFLRRTIRPTTNDYVRLHHIDHRSRDSDHFIWDSSGGWSAQLSVCSSLAADLWVPVYFAADRRTNCYRVGERYEHVNRTRLAFGMYIAQEPWSSVGH